ncbi:PaaI family thioesterase [Methylosinus sp. Ce-a6]|uniref:PaaI family thioesterase n=1 Tax=Methylosinus sp. Ce-a6 TaxID=2172005 RepID=UPI00135B05C7|nr:PaaI family thioesterase [Methylosinus sp. Ce-a6]
MIEISDHARRHSRALLMHDFQRYCGLELLEQDAGRCRCRLVVTAAIDNLSHCLHGGVTYAMLDVTSMLATLPLLAPDEYAVTTNMAVSILTPMPRDSIAEFQASVIRAGRRLIFTSATAVRVDVDDAHTPFATAQISKARLRQTISVPEANGAIGRSAS